jgi:hypothetical protein
MYLANEICHISRGSLTCYKILRHGADGYTSPPNEGVLRIFIALTNPSSSAAFEPTKLGSNDKHANHFITEDYLINHTFINCDLALLVTNYNCLSTSDQHCSIQILTSGHTTLKFKFKFVFRTII